MSTATATAGRPDPAVQSPGSPGSGPGGVGTSFGGSAGSGTSSGGSGGSGPGRSSSLERSSPGGAALRTDQGTTTIASSVVAKIAGLATQEIPGVQAMGKGMARTLGALRQKIPGGATAATTQGVSVEVGERQTAIDIDIVAYYGQSIVDTADAIRENVIDRIESMTGLEVVEVNVSVDDLYIEGDDRVPESRVE
ncbi:MAG: Asp23/Gls24 family envelope stress response protein [Acidobacteriota bacterium]|nr:Asp23/Gls24 family envelope stress response protein [Acidobacteriota bacterium]